MTAPAPEQDAPIVYVVDDDDEFRSAVSGLISTIGVEVRAYARPSELLANFDSERPGCAVVDMRLPEMSGIELLSHIAHMPAIVLSGHGDVPSAVRALRAGAVDFLEKPIRPQDLIEKIQSLLRDVEGRSLRRGREIDMHLYLESLSLRQRQILPMVVAGQSAKEIGRDLNLSHRTVEKHRKALMVKLDVSSISELIRTVSQAAATDPDIFKFD